MWITKKLRADDTRGRTDSIEKQSRLIEEKGSPHFGVQYQREYFCYYHLDRMVLDEADKIYLGEGLH